MSVVKTNNVQIGQSLTANQNFSWYQPSTPDGTVRLGVGNAGATTADVITASSTGVTIPSVSSSNTFGFKNRIINGGMVIDQRNAGASVTPTATVYAVDRWQLLTTQSSKYSAQRNAGSVTPPSGFTNYLGVTSLSTYSVASSDYFCTQQLIEGYNIADLAWGTANAASVTLTFRVYSSLTGTFGGAIRNSAGNRSYPFTYTISAANTWTTVSLTIPGETTGTWATDNTTGLSLSFGFGIGSAYSGTAWAWGNGNYLSATGAQSVVGTNGATFYITGVQLEVGSQATSFDFRSYGQELALCQRYYYKWAASATGDVLCNMSAYNTTAAWGKIIDLPVEMRSVPTGTVVGSFRAYPASGSGGVAFSVKPISLATKNALSTGGWTGSSGLVAGYCTIIDAGSSTSYVEAAAEL